MDTPTLPGPRFVTLAPQPLCAALFVGTSAFYI